ncbi:DUF7660 family protein [Streptomyces sp. NPDC004324]
MQPTVPERRKQGLGQFGRSLGRVQCRRHGRNGSRGENADLPSFLEALASWIDDADGWYNNAGRGDWRFSARALRAATIYE